MFNTALIACNTHSICSIHLTLITLLATVTSIAYDTHSICAALGNSVLVFLVSVIDYLYCSLLLPIILLL